APKQNFSRRRPHILLAAATALVALRALSGFGRAAESRYATGNRCGTGSYLAAVLPLPRRGLLAEVPRKLLKLPQDRYVGPGYDVTTCIVSQPGGGEVSLNFMLDSALTTSMLSPRVAQSLEIQGLSGSGEERRFTSSTASNQRASSVSLPSVRLKGTNVTLGPLRPLVVDFAQDRPGVGLVDSRSWGSKT
ncbi:unnamed protein product, partial [Polarella glacialis]